jgi:hypothetical protein
VDEDGGDGRAISCTSKSVQRGKSRELGENMIVKAERTGEAPESVEVIGQNVWLRKNIETSTREDGLNDSDTAPETVYRYDEVYFVDCGFPTVESVRESFDELWSVHAADGMPDSARIDDAIRRLEAVKASLADTNAALLEIGDIVGGE